MKRKIISYIAIMVLTLGLMPVTVSKATDAVTYIKEDGTADTCSNYTLLGNDNGMLTDGWYVVDGNINPQNIVISGNVNLILKNNATLVALISIIPNCTLTVFGQSGNGGQLQATASFGNFAGISVAPSAQLIIYGGTITATGNNISAGIGGDYNASNNIHGDITINGGVVNAYGGNNDTGGAAGIGGSRTQNGGDIAINGGTVTVSGGPGAEGIGKGSGGTSSGTLSLGSGMKLTGSADNINWIPITTSNRSRYMKVEPSAYVSTTPTASTGLYADGSSHALLSNGGVATNGTMKYALGTDGTNAPTTWGTSIPTGDEARTYYVWYMAESSSSSYADSAPACIEVTISNMPAATVSTLPTASTGLAANGSAQALLTSAGTATNGTMQFALGNDSTNSPGTGWGTSIPTGTEARTYYVWYKAVGDHVNYTDSAPVCITVTISAASSTPVNPPSSGNNYTYYPPAPEPKFPGGEGWTGIVKEIGNITEGGKFEINMNGTITLPTSAINAIQGKDANFVFDMGNGIKWTINGKDVGGTSGDVYLGVYLGATGIPTDVINNLTGEREKMNLMLSRDGGLGFMATLTLPLKKEWSGLTANLFNYNKGTKEMDFVSSGKINADGTTDLTIGGKTTATKSSLKMAPLLKAASADQASSFYTIVIDDHSLDPNAKPEPTVEPEPTTEPEPTVEPTPETTTYDLKLTGTSKKSKVTLSWKKLKKNKQTLKEALTKNDKKVAFKVGSKYTFKVTAYIDKSWKKKTKNAVVTVKVKK